MMIGLTLAITGQQFKDYTGGFVFVCFGFVFGVWILRNAQSRAARRMGGTVFLASILLLLVIVYHYVLSRLGRHPH